MAPALVFDNPEAYLAGDRRRALAAGTELPERVQGAVLFADISGFTPLTEALVREWGARRGAEQLSAVLDRLFDALLIHLHEHGGSVVYFSGDAVTCWLDGDDGSLATSCALAMQRTMITAGMIVLPSGTEVRLAMKVAVAVGPARRFVVGDPRVQLIDVLAGALMDEVAATERQATAGEVLLHPSAVTAGVVGEPRGDHVAVRTVVGPAPLPQVPEPALPLPEATVRPWLLPAVYERLGTGRGEFLAELRTAIPVFLRFGGLDFDADPDAPAVLDALVVAVQRIVDGYGGSVLQLTLGDKGAYLYAVFGAPLAHEDDAARACAAALELRALADVHPVTDLTLGLARGRVRSGTYGHASRRTFCCLGDPVNLAARLMAAAPPGSIHLSADLRDAAGSGFESEDLGELRVKGKAEPLRAYALVGQRRTAGRHRRHALPLIGRDAQLAELERHLVQVADGHGQLVAITAPAGSGKSRLLVELGRRLADRGFRAYEGEAQAYGTRSSYGAWHGIWSDLLSITEAADAERWLAERASALRLRAPLLGTALGLTFPDNELTAALDPALRKTSLEALLVEVITAVVADGPPLALLLEDAQWLDPLSIDLLHVLARAIVELPVLLVLAVRPDAEADLLGPLRGLPHVHELALPELDDDAAEAMLIAKLAQLGRPGVDPPPALLAAVLPRADGNPFAVEELITFVVAQGIDPADPAALAGLELPDSLHSLALSRIDTLAEGPRRTIKVASVIGRTFGVPMLRGVYPELGDDHDVSAHLATLRRVDLIATEAPAPGSEMIFRHVITAQAAYETTPEALREQLHGAAGHYLEDRTDPGSITAPQLDLLAHHFGRSTEVDRQRVYLRQAGDRAREAYANAAAIDHYRRVVPLLEPAERSAVLLQLGGVQQLAGVWADAEASYRTALALADERGEVATGARVQTALAEVTRKQGQYDEAAGWLAQARTGFEGAGDRAGVGEVLHLGGTLAAQQGQLDRAGELYRESLAIRTELDDRAGMAALFSNLAIVAEYRGDLDDARSLNERALALRLAVGDRWAIGVSQNNLGMIALLQHDPAAAVPRFAEAMRLNQEVGDPWMVAIAHNNLGNAHRDLGDLGTAAAHLGAAVAGYRRRDDRWALAIVYEDVAALALRRNDPEAALVLLGAAERVRTESGSPRTDAQRQEWDDALTDVRVRLGPRAEELIRIGTELDPTAATDAAAAACR